MIRATGTKVLIQPIFDSDTSPSGRIIIPDVAKDRADQGIIKYAGPDVKKKFDLNVGDWVIFGNYDGQAVEIEDEGLMFIMDASACRAVLGADEEYYANQEVNGLYFKTRDGQYFPATYEMAMPLLARTLQETIAKTINVKPAKKETASLVGEEEDE